MKIRGGTYSDDDVLLLVGAALEEHLGQRLSIRRCVAITQHTGGSIQNIKERVSDMRCGCWVMKHMESVGKGAAFIGHMMV